MVLFISPPGALRAVQLALSARAGITFILILKKANGTLLDGLCDLNLHSREGFSQICSSRETQKVQSYYLH